MKRSLATAIAGMTLAVALPSYAAHRHFSDDPLEWESQRPGSFVLFNDEKQTILNAKTDQHYRICVDQGSNAIGLKVKHDNAADTVKPGNCGDYEAKQIVVSPAGTLPQDWEIFGRFHKLS